MSLEKISIIVGVIVTIGGGFFGFGELFNKQETNQAHIEETKAELKEAKEKIAENEKIDVEQTVILQQTVELIKEVRADLKK